MEKSVTGVSRQTAEKYINPGHCFVTHNVGTNWMGVRFTGFVAMPRPFVMRAGVCLACLGMGLSGCSPAPVARGISDPYEAENRKRFERSVQSDRMVLRPVAHAYGEVVPAPFQQIIANFADNLSLPSSIVNDLLQANIGDAVVNTFRFAFNSTIGLGGTMDPATIIGVDARETDFGETLHVWGVQEGAYLVVPFVGPSTERDAVGTVVDLFTNPLKYVVPTPEVYAIPVSGALDTLGTRYRFTGTVDSVLYDSADPYSQARLVYLENRRFQLGGDAEEDYSDLYGNLYSE